MVAEAALCPDVAGPGSKSCKTGGTAVSIIFRIVFIVAGAVTALFVARDALNFTIIQTFVAVLLVTAVVGAGSLWSMRRKT
ncbi:hypothetical protein SAMN05216573_102302 [Bradyrhizobium sp. Rc3b]|nr:hypothetical protein CV770_05865 [Bradyrhizobium sp. AC87j1]SFM52717.1 hypothetical protein SAMN05216573_102302 [Bradyrhizobium sp. Rc3b]